MNCCLGPITFYDFNEAVLQATQMLNSILVYVLVVFLVLTNTKNSKSNLNKPKVTLFFQIQY